MATNRISKSLGTEVSIQHVSIGILNRLNLKGLMIRDRSKDTLIYAGAVKVRITDWFILKEKAVLRYAGLEDAVIKINRKDSVWNYQYIIDHFASPSPSKKKKGGLELDLKKIDLKNLRLVKNDQWVGEKMTVQFASLIIDANRVDLNNSIFLIDDIKLHQPFFAIQALPALRPDYLRKKIKASIDTGMYFNAGNMLVQAKQLKITDGKLFIDGNPNNPSNNFDGSHIQLSKLNGSFNNLSFIKDTIRADIDLAVKDRSGFELQRLKTKFRFTPQIMELASLDLRTSKSRIGNYYAMKYTDFNKDFGEYIDKVVMEARFRDAKINSDDIAFFAPELKNLKRNIEISGNYLGTVADFTTTNLYCRIGNNTNLSGTLSMKGLPDINTTKISLTKSVVTTNYNDLLSFIPVLKDIKDPNLAELGNIIYRGNFNGTIRNFVTSGVFSTALGGLTTDISLKLPIKGEPSYKGEIETTRFNIGKFLNTEALGLVNFKGDIEGSSFNIDLLKTTVNGTIDSLQFNGYTYANIITNGTFQKKSFAGELEIDDPNLNFTNSVIIDLSKEEPSFNIVGDLVQSNLKALNFVKQNIEITGLLDANFTGTNIDNFKGVAKFLNASIKDETNKISFDSLNLSSIQNDSIKILSVGSNELQATISGQFSILELPASIQSFLHHYYPVYISEPKIIPQNQRFDIKINTNYIEPYLQIFTKGITGFNDASLTGSIDTRNSDLKISANIPYGRFNKYGFNGIQLEGRGNLDTISLNANITTITINDSLNFPNTNISVVAKNDHSLVSIKTSADNTLNEASLNADVTTLEDGARIQFLPSSFVLNTKKWNLEKEGELILRKNFIKATDVKFTQGFQEIEVETEEEDGGNTNNLIVKLKNVVLGDLTSPFMKDPRLEGITSGEITMRDFFGQFNAEALLKAEQFRFNDDSIGLVNIKSGYNNKTGLIPFEIQSANKGFDFSAKGSYNLKDSIQQPLYTDIDLRDTRIHLLNQFLTGLFSDLKGQAKGKLSISGDPKSPTLLGKVKLQNAGLKVDYTQVYYTIDSANISFEEDGIDFGQFTIKDQYKNSGSVKGKLYERGFKDLAFDFDLSTNKLLLIDTKLEDNQQFYGRAIGRVSTFSLKGPESNAKMTLVAESTDSSHIYIPNSVTRESGSADFIVFKEYGTEMLNTKIKSGFNLTVDLDLTATNKTEIDVILDDLTGDVIKATGNGRLRIRAGTTEPLSIRGRYNIEKGNYDFNFQSFIRKPFELIPNAGNYIEWTGDPFKADIRIDAQYTAERIAMYDLVSNLQVDGSTKGYRGEVYVIAELRDKLTAPKIRFRLDFPQGSPVKSDNVLAQYINRLENDENEILKQVSFLIVFNTFAPPSVGNSGSSAASNSLTTIGANTLSQILTKEINKMFSNFLYKLTGDKSLRFDLGTSWYSNNEITSNVAGGTLNNNTIDRSRVNFKLGKSFFQDKMIVTFGGDLDFNVSNSAAIKNGNFQWLPDLNVEFILSKDRKLRAILFNKNSLDISNTGAGGIGRRNRFGASISYRKDFDKLFATKPDDIVFKPATDSTQKSPASGQ
ncbi:MAG: translocation/assembly module TamB domain-containing protein [Sediminibacterium sp.]|uniref:translocation/assembly module TamB domain-containing protein n=1 Tax=Sediminibacterium sp. TaxID=1917865 RepID=UPI002AB8A6B9|nr:translocation/assembly module TamB domain-containing protein [Sediminibacterium sp.]MDZ4071258.1 translocation/assembly module TamB domain-containing protein [Sediminibacterium sp.]